MRRSILTRCAVIAWSIFFAGLATRAEAADSLQLTLPPLGYAVVGVSSSIYYDNIVLTETPERYSFAITGDLGKAETRRWTVTPAARDVGDHELAVSVRDGQGKVVQQGKLVLRVTPADAGQGRAIRLLMVGDSLTNATLYPNEVARLLRQPGNPSWTMLGTHRPPAAAEGVAHEGYGGWTWERFLNFYRDPALPPPTERRSARSPFVFAVDGGASKLDLDRYFATACNGQRPDFVTFFLGINDCFGASPTDQKAMDAHIDRVFANAEKLIAAFRRAAPKAELGICLTTPPNSREAAFEANYQGKYPRWGWKRIQHRLVQRQIAQFGGREVEHLYLVPLELDLDPIDGYPADNGVHPNAAGYQQIGASLYAWLKARLAAE